jgi:hypothetical protein
MLLIKISNKFKMEFNKKCILQKCVTRRENFGLACQTNIYVNIVVFILN